MNGNAIKLLERAIKSKNNWDALQLTRDAVRMLEEEKQIEEENRAFNERHAKHAFDGAEVLRDFPRPVHPFAPQHYPDD